jgi:polyferredoxin
VDACDEVMAKLHRPRGLVRYDSQSGLSRQTKRFWRPRLYVYAGFGVLGLVVAALLVRTRVPFEANLLRLSNVPYLLEQDGARVRNALELHLINKRGEAHTFHVRGVEGGGLDYVIGMPSVELGSLESLRVPVFVSAPNDRQHREVRVLVDDGTAPRALETPFIAP